MKSLALLLTLLPLVAQETPTFRTQTSLALVRFHVERDRKYVDNLKPDDFVLLDNGTPRPFTLFEGGAAGTRNTPIEMILLFDTSGSVTDAGLLDPLVLKSDLLDGLGNLHLSVYGFDRKLHRYSGPTRSVDALQAALSQLQEKHGTSDAIALELPPKRKSDEHGGTWIYESVIAAARDASAAGNNVTRMMLVFSDGLPSTSSTPEDASPVCQGLGIPVYPVVLGHAKITADFRHAQQTQFDKHGLPTPGGMDRISRVQAKEREVEAFARLGELTGGRSFDPPAINLEMIHKILGVMVAQVVFEYVVGFAPEDTAKHKLEVRLRNKDLGKLLGGHRTLPGR